MPPPVTLSVETPPSRPDLAMAPSARSRCSSLTGVRPAGKVRSSQSGRHSPASGPLHWLFPGLTSQPAPRLHLPGVFGQCHLPGSPPTPSPRHSSPLCLRSGDTPCDVTHSLGFPVPPAAHIGAQALWAHRALGCFAGYAPRVPTRTSDHRARSGAPEVCHPQ